MISQDIRYVNRKRKLFICFLYRKILFHIKSVSELKFLFEQNSKSSYQKTVNDGADNRAKLYTLENTEAKECKGHHNAQSCTKAVISGFDLVYVTAELYR